MKRTWFLGLLTIATLVAFVLPNEAVAEVGYSYGSTGFGTTGFGSYPFGGTTGFGSYPYGGTAGFGSYPFGGTTGFTGYPYSGTSGFGSYSYPSTFGSSYAPSTLGYGYGSGFSSGFGTGLGTGIGCGFVVATCGLGSTFGSLGGSLGSSFGVGSGLGLGFGFGSSSFGGGLGFDWSLLGGLSLPTIAPSYPSIWYPQYLTYPNYGGGQYQNFSPIDYSPVIVNVYGANGKRVPVAHCTGANCNPTPQPGATTATLRTTSRVPVPGNRFRVPRGARGGFPLTH